MPKVFISHSNQDHESTLFVIDSLRRAGFDVWVDFENIRGGDDWLCEIQAGITRCDAVVTILSQASTQSVWVERECLFAFQLKKPLLTALVADVLIPLHLINIQYCDFREQASSGMVKLVESLETLLTSVDDSRDYPVAALSRQPLEANFFPYLEQLPTGDVARMVAQDLFYWARRIADEVAFGGRSNPGFHTRIMVNGKTVTVFTIWAYRKTPSVQLPLDYLSRPRAISQPRHTPYDLEEAESTAAASSAIRRVASRSPSDLPASVPQQRRKLGRLQRDCAGDYRGAARG